MQEGTHSVVLVTCPNRDEARELARMLVKRNLVACGQMLDIESVYIWEDEIREEPEVLLILKARTDAFCQIQSAVLENHSYEVPQVVQLPITASLPAYLSWINERYACV